MQVKTGDKVIYSKYSGTQVELDGEEYIIVKQSDILAIMEQKNLVKAVLIQYKIEIGGQISWQRKLNMALMQEKLLKKV